VLYAPEKFEGATLNICKKKKKTKQHLQLEEAVAKNLAGKFGHSLGNDAFCLVTIKEWAPDIKILVLIEILAKLAGGLGRRCLYKGRDGRKRL
jgi:hypothetical protein